MTPTGTLHDRVAIVTGAAQGIGRATAVRLASEGAVVTCADPQDCNANAHLVRRLGRPEGIAAMVVYLFREASFQTGITFPVDGGWAAKGNF